MPKTKEDSLRDPCVLLTQRRQVEAHPARQRAAIFPHIAGFMLFTFG
jgi:hypothetical protein